MLPRVGGVNNEFVGTREERAAFYTRNDGGLSMEINHVDDLAFKTRTNSAFEYNGPAFRQLRAFVQNRKPGTYARASRAPVNLAIGEYTHVTRVASGKPGAREYRTVQESQIFLHGVHYRIPFGDRQLDATAQINKLVYV